MTADEEIDSLLGEDREAKVSPLATKQVVASRSAETDATDVPPSMKPKYTFPDLADVLAPLDLPTEELMAQLRDIQIAGATCYTKSRIASIRIQLQLNRRGELAPRFRPRARARRRGPKGTPYQDADLSNDTQIIDLHWLHCRAAKYAQQVNKWTPLGYLHAPFNFQLAADFVATGGSPERKVAILGIGPTDQWEMAALQAKPCAQRWRTIEFGRDDAGGEQMGMEDVRVLLYEQARGNMVLMQYVDDWTMLWACWRLSQTEGTRLARLYALATGKRLEDAGNVKRRLAAVRKRLP